MTEIKSWLMEAMNFAKGEVPIVINEIIKYHTCLYIFGLVTAVSFLLIAYFVGRKMWDKGNRITTGGDNKNDWHCGSVAISIIFYTTGIILLITNCIFLLKIHIAPRVFLLESFASLIQ